MQLQFSLSLVECLKLSSLGDYFQHQGASFSGQRVIPLPGWALGVGPGIRVRARAPGSAVATMMNRCDVLTGAHGVHGSGEDLGCEIFVHGGGRRYHHGGGGGTWVWQASWAGRDASLICERKSGIG